MDPRTRAPLVLAAMALLLGGLAFVLLERPETGPPLPTPEEQARDRARSDGPPGGRERSESPDPRHPTADRGASSRARATVARDRRAADARSDPAPAAPGTEAARVRSPRAADAGLEPWEDDPVSREEMLQEAVLAVITAAAPEFGDAAVERSCDADGNLCVIEGPWPGDDFLSRWVNAIADGAVTRDDLHGVTFQSFEVVEHAEGRRFSVTAVAPR